MATLSSAVTLAAKPLSLPLNHRARAAAAFHSPKPHLKRAEFKFFSNGSAASVHSLTRRLRVSSNDAHFNSGPEESQQQQSSSFAEFITSERVKVVAMLALALALCNADRVVMSVAIVPLSLANGWSRAFAGIVQVLAHQVFDELTLLNSCF